MAERLAAANALVTKITSRVPLREVPLAVVLIGLIVWFTISSPLFLTEANLLNLGRAYFVELAFITLAAGLVFLLRGIDLSVAATLALSAVTLGWLTTEMGLDVWTATVIVLIIGMAAGAVNGCLIVFVHLSPIVATLTTLTLYRGIALGISRGESYSGFPSEFAELGSGTLAGIPTQVVLLAVIVAVLVFIMHRTILGRWVYAIGGNPDASRFAGLPVNRVTIGVYATSGLLSAIGGVVAVARFNTARADFATGGELDAITAAILGGVSIMGGAGYLVGALAGALSIAVLRNGMTLIGESGFLQVVVIGTVLIVAVLIDRAFQVMQQRHSRREQLDALAMEHEQHPESGDGSTPPRASEPTIQPTRK